MQSTDKRFAEAKRRAARAARRRRDHRLMLLSGGLCLSLLAGVSLLLPNMLSGQIRRELAYSGAAGSLFLLSGAAGYIVIGILAFALGVSFTLLCLFLRRRREEGERETSDD